MKTKKQHYVFAVSNRSGKNIRSVVVSEADLWSVFERLFQREGVQLASSDRVFLPDETIDYLSDISVLCGPTFPVIKNGRKRVLVSRKAVQAKKVARGPRKVAEKRSYGFPCSICGYTEQCIHRVSPSERDNMTTKELNMLPPKSL